MRFSFWPHASQSWEDILTLCRHAEATGWEGLWIADHFMPNAADVSGPVHEVWTLLAALAAAVPRVRIGPMVSCNTYRHPAVLAKMAATVDHISNGRLVLGYGAGWQENEHAAYGLEFYTVGQRLRRMEEACRIIKSLFTERRTTLDGKYYKITDAPLEPKPVQNPLPLLIGGGGEKVTLRIVAELADEWNVWGDPKRLGEKMAILDDHCRAVGRDPKTIKRTAATLIHLSDDPAANEKARSQPRYATIAGNADELRETIREYARIGVDELIVADFFMGPMAQKTAMLDQFIREVAPAGR
ncbi:MAG: TIGR03560 family F420-dependent LLM class oxidoreductase [Ectothiorhodospiraceae bacterium]|nr:TIGR03560 family F420-dependent LLM class oxidoreductase [Ectothiorhodospiraceae bacterium]